jgi:hypothetical protein
MTKMTDNVAVLQGFPKEVTAVNDRRKFIRVPGTYLVNNYRSDQYPPYLEVSARDGKLYQLDRYGSVDYEFGEIKMDEFGEVDVAAIVSFVPDTGAWDRALALVSA